VKRADGSNGGRDPSLVAPGVEYDNWYEWLQHQHGESVDDGLGIIALRWL